MSYQQQTQVEPSNEKQKPSYKIALIFPVLAVLGFIAVSYHSSASPKLTPVLQFSKTKSYPTYTKMTEDEKSELFETFKSRFTRNYEDMDEEKARYKNFLATLEVIDSRNDAEAANGGSAVHGITKFSDYSTDEIKSMLGFSESAKVPKMSSKVITSVDTSNTKVTSVDWSGIYTTAVKDQGYCGSCWAFSATEQIESDSIRAGYLTTDDTLSPQQIVSCDTYSDGCDGGITISAYYYVYENGGLDTDTAYPYTSYYDVTGTCSVDATSYSVSVTDYFILANETVMEDYILSTGPISICLDASSWYTYTSGVLSTCTTDVDHCVQAVGLNLDAETNGYDEGYWIVRNSWGTDWGVAGNIYLKAGENLCDLDYLSTYVTTVPVKTSKSKVTKDTSEEDSSTSEDSEDADVKDSKTDKSEETTSKSDNTADEKQEKTDNKSEEEDADEKEDKTNNNKSEDSEDSTSSKSDSSTKKSSKTTSTSTTGTTSSTKKSSSKKSSKKSSK